MAFMPQNAPWVLLGFMFTGFVLGASALAVIYAWVVGQRVQAMKILAAGATVPAAYLALLLTASLLSHERVLAPGEQKYFCEVDCHEAYSVVDVKRAKALGAAPNQTTARGDFYIVTIRVWFDERTIASHRGYAPLTPNPRVARVLDDSGREYGLSEEGQAALERLQGKSIPFAAPLRPGESYQTTLVFDLSAEVKNPRLDITTSQLITWFIVGHENSPFHKRVLFRLPASGERTKLTAGVRSCV